MVLRGEMRMKTLGICLFAALCAVLSGCAGAQREIREEAPLEPSGETAPAAEDGALLWRDDFDHAGEGLRFERVSP